MLGAVFALVSWIGATPSFTPPPKHTIRLTSVKMRVLINYPHKLSSGQMVYPEWLITRKYPGYQLKTLDSRGFRLTRDIPPSVEERARGQEGSALMSPGIYSEKTPLRPPIKKTYTIDNDKIYTVYVVNDYNCYDPQCAGKHGHTRFATGTTYFSPDYGILLQVDAENMEYHLLASIGNVSVPLPLVLALLHERKTDERIIREFQRRTSASDKS